MDILVIGSQIAMSWADQPDIPIPDNTTREAFMAERRAAIVVTVQRLFSSARPS